MSASGDDARADWLGAARALAPRIAADADEIEQTRCLPDPLVDALSEAGLFRLLLPTRFGGGELDPMTFACVIEEVATVPTVPLL